MIFLDIETEPLPLATLQRNMPKFSAPSNWKDEAKIAENVAKQESDWIAKAALSPMTGRVLAVGLIDDEKYWDFTDEVESNLLETTWAMLTHHGAYTEPVAGWNLLGFDLPFLVKRSWICGVPVPKTTLETYKGRSYFNPQFHDLMLKWGMGDRHSKLDDVLTALGLENKRDLDGRLFYELYRNGQEAEALAYLERDVTALRDIHTRIQ